MSKLRRLIFFVFSLIILTTACSRNQIVPALSGSKTSEISEKTKELIQKLKDEDAQLSNKTSPTDINSINDTCHEILYSIMNEYDSIGLESDIILDKNSNMYIKISSNIKINNSTNRLVEFGKKNPAEGSSTKVYIQSFDDKSVSLKEILTVYTNSNNIARIGPSNIYNFDGKHYAVVSDLRFDPDKNRDYIRLTVFSLTNNLWNSIEVSDFMDYKNIFVDKGSTYDLESSDKGLKILIKNKDGKVLGQRLVDFMSKTMTQK